MEQSYGLEASWPNEAAQTAQTAQLDARGEEGFTLIELLVALMLFAIVIAPLAEVLYTSVSTAVGSQLRSEAIGLASQSANSAAAASYGEVGFYQNQLGYTATWNGLNTVDLGATAPGSVPLQPSSTTTAPGLVPLQPSSTTTEGSTNFRVQTYIVWSPASVLVPGSSPSTTVISGSTEAYKQVTAIVCWQKGPGPAPSSCVTSGGTIDPSYQHVQEVTVVYPGGLPPTVTTTSGGG